MALSCWRLLSSWSRVWATALAAGGEVREEVNKLVLFLKTKDFEHFIGLKEARKEAITSLSKPPWSEVQLPDPAEEAKHHIEVVQNVKTLISTGAYGRLFAVVHFASRQWKVTNEDLILIENHIEAECGDRIRLEKVLLVGGSDFTLIGRPLLGRDLVRVEATVVEKTESWPKIHFRFKRRKRYRRTRINVQPQTVLRINTIEIAPALA